MNSLTLVKAFFYLKFINIIVFKSFVFEQITCIFVFLGFASANPTVRESRHVVPVEMIDGMTLMADDTTGSLIRETFNPIMINPRNLVQTPDQQTEEQRYGWGGGWGGGRPYYGGGGGGWGGGRPYGN